MAKPVSTSAPYATQQDPPVYQKRELADKLAPWEKDQSLPVNVRGHHPYTAAEIAPYGNHYNQPRPRQLHPLETAVFPPYATDNGWFREFKERPDDTPRIADLQKMAE